MLISVIIPVYNMENTIGKCIESLQRQTNKNFEIIIINDGSTDNTHEICTFLTKKIKNINYYNTPNQGSGPARNYGIKKSSGEYLLFIDADDYLYENAIEILSDNINTAKADLIIFGYEKRKEFNKESFYQKKFEKILVNGKEVRMNYEKHFSSNYSLGIQGAPWNKVFKKSVINENEITFPALKRHQDEVFISRYVNFSNKIFFIDEILYVHYINNSKLRYEKFPINYIDIVNELFDSRNEIIGSWNPSNDYVNKLMYYEYIYNLIKSFDIVFSKKQNLTYKQKKKWIAENFNKVRVTDKNFENTFLSNYSNIKEKQILFFEKSIINSNVKSIYLFLVLRKLIETKFNKILDKIKSRSFST